MVFGDFKKYLTALITLNPDELKGSAKGEELGSHLDYYI
jgi:long-subunit acyl-CoA synthetase (AMP-forming)